MSAGQIFPPLGIDDLTGEEKAQCGKLIGEVARFMHRLVADLLACNRDDARADAVALAAEAERDRFVAEHGCLGKIAWQDAWTVFGVLIDRRERRPRG